MEDSKGEAVKGRREKGVGEGGADSYILGMVPEHLPVFLAWGF